MVTTEASSSSSVVVMSKKNSKKPRNTVVHRPTTHTAALHVDLLPIELLQNIFWITVNVGDWTRQALIISRVSRRWKEIAESYHVLWTEVDLSLPGAEQILERFLPLAGNHPVHVVIPSPACFPIGSFVAEAALRRDVGGAGWTEPLVHSGDDSFVTCLITRPTSLSGAPVVLSAEAQSMEGQGALYVEGVPRASRIDLCRVSLSTSEEPSLRPIRVELTHLKCSLVTPQWFSDIIFCLRPLSLSVLIMEDIAFNHGHEIVFPTIPMNMEVEEVRLMGCEGHLTREVLHGIRPGSLKRLFIADCRKDITGFPSQIIDRDELWKLGTEWNHLTDLHLCVSDQHMAQFLSVFNGTQYDALYDAYQERFSPGATDDGCQNRTRIDGEMAAFQRFGPFVSLRRLSLQLSSFDWTTDNPVSGRRDLWSGLLWAVMARSLLYDKVGWPKLQSLKVNRSLVFPGRTVARGRPEPGSAQWYASEVEEFVILQDYDYTPWSLNHQFQYAGPGVSEM